MKQVELAKAESDALLDLARGKYDAEIAAFDRLCVMLAPLSPAVMIVKRVVDGVIMLNKLTAPLHVALGEGGSFVPIMNSRVMPDGSLRPYNPRIDGPSDEVSQGGG